MSDHSSTTGYTRSSTGTGGLLRRRRRRRRRLLGSGSLCISLRGELLAWHLGAPGHRLLYVVEMSPQPESHGPSESTNQSNLVSPHAPERDSAQPDGTKHQKKKSTTVARGPLHTLSGPTDSNTGATLDGRVRKTQGEALGSYASPIEKPVDALSPPDPTVGELSGSQGNVSKKSQ